MTCFFQKMKLEKKEKILQVALKHFTENSFHNVSLRKIASELEICVGNLYNYFHNKEALFASIMSPLLDKIAKIKEMVDSHAEFEFEQMEDDLKHHMKIGEVIANFVSTNKNLVYILFFHSKGSSLEHVIDDLIDFNTERINKEICNKWGEDVFDTFFVHNIISYSFNTIKESLMHDLSAEQRRKAFREMMAFVYCGVAGLATRNLGRDNSDFQKSI